MIVKVEARKTGKGWVVTCPFCNKRHYLYPGDNPDKIGEPEFGWCFHVNPPGLFAFKRLP
jgi:hypothetical protein